MKPLNIKKTETLKNMTKLATTPRLYTEVEMASHPGLRFKETWTIVSKDGLYVHSYLQNNKIAEYSSDEKKSGRFYNVRGCFNKTQDTGYDKPH